MIAKFRLYLISLLVIFMLCIENVNAETNKPLTDSTCCTPENLQSMILNDSVFCLSWKFSLDDSTCTTLYGFEVQWKLRSYSFWNSDVVFYTSETAINYCDSIDTCGKYDWRVRTICLEDSTYTYSDWVNGDDFEIPCKDSLVRASQLIIAPNPARSNITISTGLIKAGQVHLSIVNMDGKSFFTKRITNQVVSLLQEKVDVSNWPKGVYFITVSDNRKVLSRKSFLKE